MYDSKKHIWVADCQDKELMRWAMEPATEKQPESRFLRADAILSEHRRGSEAADGVYLMEEAAKADYAPAVYGMGQMFQWGWAVRRDRKRALEYYRKAAELGYEPAVTAIANVRRQRNRAIAAFTSAAVLCAVAVCVFVHFLPELTGKRVITVNKETELSEPATLEEFTDEIMELIRENDDYLVVSGQVSTNRVLLRFDGNRIDLSDFLASRVIARDDNLIVIQFATEEEANRCLEELSNMDGVRYAGMDSYDIAEKGSDGSDLPIVTDVSNTSSYNSWGVADMGLDQLSAYCAANCSDRSVIVAIIDSGVLPGVDADSRLLPGIKLSEGTDSTTDPDMHGTHVAGIVFDGTRDTTVQILPIDYTVREINPTTGEIEHYASIQTLDLALQYAIREGASVINFSQGSQHNEIAPRLISDVVAQGIVFVQAAGNETADTMSDESTTCPSELQCSLIVGAYNIDHEICSFSNYGDSVDVCAPGEEIYSWYFQDPMSLIPLQGTSMAAPHVSALAGLVKLMYPDATPAQVELYIKDYCRINRNPTAYATGLYGAGAPDATGFIEN